jgi:transposase InsO family protein
VADFMRRAIKWFAKQGIIFKAILSDNGLEFTTHHKESRDMHVFEKVLIKHTIKHKYTRVCRPQTNGKVERWWQILETELFRKYTFTSW